MSKTYTLTATSLARYTGTGRAILTDGASCTKVAAAASNYVGYQSAYKAVRAEFDPDVIAHLRTLGSGAVSSVTLDIPVTGSSLSTPTLQTYYGCCKSTSDAHCYVDAPKNLNLTGSGGSTFTLDATQCGIPLDSCAYAFGGARSGKTADYYKTVGSGIRLTVVTAEEDITLSYDPNGGTGAPAAETLTAVGSAHFTVSGTVPARTGYSFSGWATTANAAAAAYTEGDGLELAASGTLYAVWTPLTYTVAFRHGSNAGGTDRAVIKTYGVTAYLLNAATAPYAHNDLDGIAGTGAGFVHDGWSLSEDGNGLDYTFGQKYTANAAITLYPHFTPRTCTLSFDAAGGSACPGRAVTFASAYGEPFPLPERTGYIFGGWYAPGAETATLSTDIFLTPGDIMLTAHWIPLTFTVTYTDGETDFTQTVSYGTPWTAAAGAFTRAGHTQTGWSTAPGGAGTLFETGSAVACWEEMTLYPVFTPKAYTLAFDAQGGSPCEALTVTYGLPLGALPVPARQGYAFTGWFTAAEGGRELTEASTFTGTEDLTAYARWTPALTEKELACSLWLMTLSGPRPAVLGEVRNGRFVPGLLLIRREEE